MIGNFVRVCFVTMVLFAGTSAAQDAPGDVSVALQKPMFYGSSISPDGNFLAAGISDGDYNGVIIADISTGAEIIVAENTGGFQILWTEWASNDRLLFNIGGLTDRNGQPLSREKAAEYKANGRLSNSSWIGYFSRVMSVDRNGEDPVAMPAGDPRYAGSSTRIVDVLSDDPDHILMSFYRDNGQEVQRLSASTQRRPKWSNDVWKVNIRTGEYDRLLKGKEKTYRWLTNSEGMPVLRYDRAGDSNNTLVYHRKPERNRWDRLRALRPSQQPDFGMGSEDFEFLSPAPSANHYYVKDRADDADKVGIYLYDYMTDQRLEKLFEHDIYDASSILVNDATAALFGYIHRADIPVYTFLDPVHQEQMDSLQEMLGGDISIDIVDTDNELKAWLLFVSGPAEPGKYYVYRPEESTLSHLSDLYDEIDASTLGNMTVVKYQARDGLELTGYLTRPSGTQDGDTPPLIVMPHGGPEARDYLRYDTDVQLLAQSGYQVFQPNFRGSSGYGRAFAEMGERQWGKAMQTDVEDGFAHLVAAGLADANTACIYGHSYGGYVALQAATATPDLYKCIIATSSPSDLQRVMRYQKLGGTNTVRYQYWERHIGHPSRDADALRAASPVRHAGKVMRPVLLIHGEMDRTVPVEHSREMNKALSRAGKTVTYIEQKKSSHNNGADVEEEEALSAILTFLREHLPAG